MKAPSRTAEDTRQQLADTQRLQEQYRKTGAWVRVVECEKDIAAYVDVLHRLADDD